MGDNLLCLMKDLQKRIEKLEKDNRELKKWANKERKKIDVIAWLNEHYLPTEDFPEWVKSMEFTESELEFVFHSGLERGIFTIIKQRMPLENRRHFPIIAFKHQLKSIFYVYEKDSWRKIKKGEFENMINAIDHKLLVVFNAWEINHPEMLCASNMEIWSKKLKCILMPPEKAASIIGRIEKKVHMYLSLNLKNIVEYEFVF